LHRPGDAEGSSNNEGKERWFEKEGQRGLAVLATYLHEPNVVVWASPLMVGGNESERRRKGKREKAPWRMGVGVSQWAARGNPTFQALRAKIKERVQGSNLKRLSPH
jgi:hypothetical protein